MRQTTRPGAQKRKCQFASTQPQEALKVSGSTIVKTVSGRFEFSEDGIFKLFTDKNGKQERIQLTNFNARVDTVRVIHGSDGVKHEFDLSLCLHRVWRTSSFSPADLFERDWAVRHFGALATISAHRETPDLVRVAIQALAEKAASEIRVETTGWVEIGGRYLFAHAGGCVGAEVPVQNLPPATSRNDRKSSSDNTNGPTVPEIPETVEVKTTPPRVAVNLPAIFDKYRLPPSPKGYRRANSLELVRDLVDLGPPRVMYPLIAAIVWCIVDRPRWPVFIAGMTGSFKTTLALLLGSFFAPGLKEHDVLAWNSTANAISAALAIAKNVLLLVDEFVPQSSFSSPQAAYRKADDVLRPAANGTPRYRCNSTGTLRNDAKVPQGLVLSTGEQFPEGESLEARMLAIDLSPGDIGWPDSENSRLTTAQFHAEQGRFAEFTSAFIQWLAPDIIGHRRRLNESSDRFRELFRDSRLHGRQIDMAADLYAATELLLDFLLNEGAITPEAADQYWLDAYDAICDQLLGQLDRAITKSPVKRFIELLKQAFILGRVYVKRLDVGERSADTVISPEALGYRAVHRTVDVLAGRTATSPDSAEEENQQLTVDVSAGGTAGSPDSGDEEDRQRTEVHTSYEPRGKQIGFKEYDNLYLTPHAALAAVEALASESRTPCLGLSPITLGKALKADGLLKSHSDDRNTLKKRLEGSTVDVFHLSVREVFDVPDWSEDWVSLEENERDQAEQAALEEETLRKRLLDERERHWSEKMSRYMFGDEHATTC